MQAKHWRGDDTPQEHEGGMHALSALTIEGRPTAIWRRLPSVAAVVFNIARCSNVEKIGHAYMQTHRT